MRIFINFSDIITRHCCDERTRDESSTSRHETFSSPIFYIPVGVAPSRLFSKPRVRTISRDVEDTTERVVMGLTTKAPTSGDRIIIIERMATAETAILFLLEKIVHGILKNNNATMMIWMIRLLSRSLRFQAMVQWEV